MPKTKSLSAQPKTRSRQGRARFDVESYLMSTGPARRIVKYREGEVLFAQGDACDDVRYLQKGAVKLSVLSHLGK